MAELNDIQLRIVVQGTGLENLTRMNDALGRSMSGMVNAAGAAKGATSAWSNFRSQLSELEHKFDAVFRAASHLQALGSELTGMGKAGLGLLRETVGEWGKYEYALNRAAGATEIFDTKTPIYKKLNQAIVDVAKEVRVFPAEEVAMGFYHWGAATGQVVKSQKDLEVISKGVTAILKAAAVTNSDVESSIKGVYAISKQYNMGLEDTEEITMKLVQSSQKTALEFNNLIEAFKMTGPVAASAGASFDDMVTFLGIIGDAGIRGSQAGRALRQTFIKLVKPTSAATDVLNLLAKEQLGSNKAWRELVFPEGKFVGMTKYVDLLARATMNLTDEQRGNTLANITTANELPVMTALVNAQTKAIRAGTNAWDDQKYSLEGAKETFDQMFNLLKHSWQGVLGLISNTIGPIVRMIGASVAEMAVPFLQSFGSMLEVVYKFLDTNPELVKWGVRIAAIASAVLILAGTLFTALGVLLAFGAGFAFVAGTLKIAFTGTSKAIDILDSSGKIIGQRMVFVQGVLSRFLPIMGFIAVAVGAFVAIWVNNFGGLRDAIEKVVAAFINVAKSLDFNGGQGFSILERLGNLILPVLEGVAINVARGLEKVADALNWIAGNEKATKVLQVVLDVVLAIMAVNFALRIGQMALSILTLGGNAAGAAGSIGTLLSKMRALASWEGLRHPIQSVKNLGEAFKQVGSTAKTNLGNIKKTFDEMVFGVQVAVAKVKMAMSGMSLSTVLASNTMKLAIKGVLIATGIGLLIVAVTTLYEAWTNNWGDIQGKFAAVVDWITARFGEFSAWIGSTWDTITSTIGAAVTNIVNFFRDLPNKIGTFFSQLWTNISTWVGSIVTTIMEFPGTLWDGITTGFTNIMTFLGEWWSSLGDSTAERVGFVVGFIIAMPIRALIELVKGFMAIWTWVTEWWTAFHEAARKWVTGVVITIADWIGKLPGRIADFLGMIWSKFITWGGEFLAAAGRWVTSVVTTILDWISKLPGRIATFFGQVWTNVSKWFSGFITSVGTWAGNAVTSIINFIQQLPGKIMSWFGTTYRDVSSWFTGQFIPNIGTWARDAINKVVDWFVKLPGYIIDSIGKLIPKLKSFFYNLPGEIMSRVMALGEAIIGGVWKGISGAIGWFTDQVTGFFRGIIEGVKSALGISSPSKVFATIGEQMMAGLSLGVDKNHDAVAALRNQVDTLIGTAQKFKTDEFGVLSGNMAFSTDDERHLIIEHRVSSPDGTVNNASREQMREIFTAEEFVSSLEHMAVVS